MISPQLTIRVSKNLIDVDLYGYIPWDNVDLDDLDNVDNWEYINVKYILEDLHTFNLSLTIPQRYS